MKWALHTLYKEIDGSKEYVGHDELTVAVNAMKQLLELRTGANKEKYIFICLFRKRP